MIELLKGTSNNASNNVKRFLKGNSLEKMFSYLMLSLLFFKNSQTNLYPKRKSTEKSETTSTQPLSNLSSRNRVLEPTHDVLHNLCCWRHKIFKTTYLSICGFYF